MTFVRKILDGLRAEPDTVRIIDRVGEGNARLDGRTIHQRVLQLGNYLDGLQLQQDAVVGIVMSNSADWVIADLACLAFGYTTLPLPLGFSRYQAEFLADRCTVFLVDAQGKEVLHDKWLLADLNAIRVKEVYQQAISDDTLALAVQADDWVCKIIHTSGTTSRPKGVKQSLGGLSVMLESLLQRVPGEIHQHYLSLVPLSLLIEQVTAIYLPLLSGGKVQFLAPAVPLIGERESNLQALITQVVESGATAMTVPPVMLEEILVRAETDPALASYLEANVHITVGGAPVSVLMLQRLEQIGITAFEGYGLSENGSVISVSTPEARKIGSVGRPLAHVEVRINNAGRIEIKSGSLFAGYSWVDPSACQLGSDGWLDTGDLGHIDAEGFLYVRGRAKNLICLPNGRNVSPEQVEVAYRGQQGVIEAILYLTDSGTLSVALVIDSAFDRVQTERWAGEWFSEIECPKALLTLRQDDPALLGLRGKTIIEKRRILAAVDQHVAV
ncbi:MAG: AMP-binding protein [Pseudomonas sp.]